jgi:hypothetical protein
MTITRHNAGYDVSTYAGMKVCGNRLDQLRTYCSTLLNMIILRTAPPGNNIFRQSDIW